MIITNQQSVHTARRRCLHHEAGVRDVATAAAACQRFPAMPQPLPLGLSARRLLGRPSSVATTASQGYGATSLSSLTIPTSSSPDGARSQPESPTGVS